MQFSLVALSAFVASVAAQAPAGCSPDYNGNFQIAVYNTSTAPAKRDLQQRAACGSGTGALVLSLQGGNLLDQDGRTGYIASNFQFQFDKPVQDGALVTSGFSACSNNSLALGSSEVFYRCLSGNFYNLYNTNWAAQCEPVAIGIVACDGATGPGSAAPGSGSSSGSVSAAVAPSSAATTTPATTAPATTAAATTSAATPAVTQKTDGQPQAPTTTAAPVVSQITDGQPQAPTASAVSTGAASHLRMGAEVAAAVAGVAAIAML